jgi:hypothetical protein
MAKTNAVKTVPIGANPVPKNTPVVSTGGLNPSAKLLATGKLPRAAQNLARNKALNGLTVSAAISGGTVNATDIKYDLKRGFFKLG